MKLSMMAATAAAGTLMLMGCTKDLNIPIISPNPITAAQQQCVAINGAAFVKGNLDAFKSMSPIEKAEFAVSGVDAIALTCEIALNQVTRAQVQTGIIVAGTLLK